MSEPATKPSYRWVTPCIVLLALALRVGGLARESAWNDEVLTLFFLHAGSLGNYLDTMMANDPGIRPFPVYFYVEYAWAQVFGSGLISMRMLSVAASMSALGLLMGIARRLFDRKAAWGAGLLFAVALPHIYFAQEVRFYAFVTAVVMLSIHSFLRALDSKDRRWWIAHFAVSVPLLWTHIYGGLIWAVFGLFLLLYHRDERRLLISWIAFHFALCLLFGLWLTRLDYVIEEVYVRQATPTYRELLNAFNIYAGGRFGKLNPAAYLPSGLSLDRLITIALGLLSLALGVHLFRSPTTGEERPAGERRGFVFAVLWLVAPPLILFLVSQVWKPLFVFRYTLYCSLGLYLLTGKALSSLHHPRAQSLLAALLVVLFGHQLTVLAQPFRPDYRAANAYISERASYDDRVYVLKHLNGLAFAYGGSLDADRFDEIAYEGLGELFAALDRQVASGGTAWMVLWKWDDFEIIETHFEDHETQFLRHEFAGIPPLILYEAQRAP